MADDIFGQSNTPPAPGAQTNTSNYIDEYVPPQAGQPVTVGSDNPVTSIASTAPSAPAAQMTPASSNQYHDVVPEPATPAASSEEPTQSLEDQNIFTLLGVQDGTDQEKESFLDELQQVIWEDFLENDVELLLTEQEMSELKQILGKADVSDLQKQEEAVVFLEKLIPDLEEIMLEKALELKEAMVRERFVALTDVYGSDPAYKEALNKAEASIDLGFWRDAADAMNSIVRKG